MNERKCVYAFFLLEWLYHSKLEAGRLKVDEQIDRFDYFSFSFHKFSHFFISMSLNGKLVNVFNYKKIEFPHLYVHSKVHISFIYIFLFIRGHVCIEP